MLAFARTPAGHGFAGKLLSTCRIPVMMRASCLIDTIRMSREVGVRVTVRVKVRFRIEVRVRISVCTDARTPAPAAARSPCPCLEHVC